MQATQTAQKNNQPKITTAYKKKNELSLSDKKALFLQAATSWVVQSAQPFRVVEGEAFRQMFNVLDPFASSTIVNVTNKSVRGKLKQMGRYAKGALELALKNQHVAWTSDHWTGPNDETYTTTTGHYIDNQWVIMSACLDFKIFEGSTTGVRIAADMEDVLRSHGLIADSGVNSVISIKPMGVTDTTGNMIVMGRELRGTQQMEHGFCIDHLLHLTAKKAFNCEYHVCVCFCGYSDTNTLEFFLSLYRQRSTVCSRCNEKPAFADWFL
jgi:hypothetical protein